MIVHTARMGYRGTDGLDVSLMGNMRRIKKGETGGHKGIGFFFAPSFKLLSPYLALRKQGKETEDTWLTYAENYRKEMRASYRNYKPVWNALLACERVVLLCFCTNPIHCHRTVLAEILGKLGATCAGELTTSRS